MTIADDDSYGIAHTQSDTNGQQQIFKAKMQLHFLRKKK